jgi:hypothetical protein
MKKAIVVLVLVVLLTVALASVAHAAQGGAPGLHGVDGKTFGALVSYAAKNCPAELVAHVRGGPIPCVP